MDEYRALQFALTLRPEQGALIPGTGGLRKIRWGAGAKGKRGGLRIIYFWDPVDTVVFLLLVYSKNQQEDLRPDQISRLKRIVEMQLKRGN